MGSQSHPLTYCMLWGSRVSVELHHTTLSLCRFLWTVQASPAQFPLPRLCGRISPLESAWVGLLTSVSNFQPLPNLRGDLLHGEDDPERLQEATMACHFLPNPLLSRVPHLIGKGETLPHPVTLLRMVCSQPEFLWHSKNWFNYLRYHVNRRKCCRSFHFCNITLNA